MARCMAPDCSKFYGCCEVDREAWFESCPYCGRTPSEQRKVRDDDNDGGGGGSSDEESPWEDEVAVGIMTRWYT